MDNLQIKYAELFTLSVEQLFYQNKICRKYKTDPVLDLQIQPTAACRSIMQRMDLVYRDTPANGGFIVLGRVLGKNGSGNDLLRFPPKAGDKLTFLLLLKNPDMINFNDLPTQLSGDQLYYFSNGVSDAAAPRSSLHLSKDAAGVSGAGDLLKKTAATYRFHAASPITPGTVKVQHLLTGLTVEPVSLINQGGQADATFSLSSLPSGQCQLLLNGVPADTFYYTGSSAVSSVFGVVEIILSPDLDSNYRVIEPDRSLTDARPLFLIRFINRKTTWRYTIHLQSNSPLYLEMAALNDADKTDFLNKLNIVSNDTTILFNKSVNSDTDFAFETDHALPLQESYFSSTGLNHDPLNLTFKKYIGDAREAAVRGNLPYPSTTLINATTPPSVYSDIFLTI